MKVLCVAEKPSIAKSITEILSGGRWDTVSLPSSGPSIFLSSPSSFFAYYSPPVCGLMCSVNQATNMYETTTLATTFPLPLVIEAIPILPLQLY